MSNRCWACRLKVDPKRTSDGRSICGLPGKLYCIRGGVASLVEGVCRRHVKKLEKLGREVFPLTPLEESAFKNQQKNGAV
jgi:hypothetical protein